MRTLAIVGTGGIAGFHAQALRSPALADRVRLVAAVDLDAERLADFGARHGIERLYPSVEALLAASPAPDIVDLCTPPGLHAEQAIELLDAGIPVVCEKPPALSLAELDRIASHERAGVHFATIFQHRFGSGGLALAELVADGSLGSPMTAVCHTLWYRPDEYFAVAWRGRWETEGGGPTMGHGIHQMDLMLAILGPWRSVTAVAARLAKPIATEDLSCALVTFESGAVATVVNSLVSPRQTSYLRFDFTEATVELEHLYGYGDSDWKATGAPGQEERVEALWRSRLCGVSSGHTAQFTHVLDALASNRVPPVSTAAVRPTMELVAAVYASAFAGCAVHSGEIAPGNPFYQRMQGTGAPWPAPGQRLALA